MQSPFWSSSGCCHPVIYPVSLVPREYQWLLALNPMGGSLTRNGHPFWGINPLTGFARYLLFYYFADFYQRMYYFRKKEKTFADVV
jgi:ABC-type polysaccharide/polyol phosphate export permease